MKKVFAIVLLLVGAQGFCYPKNSPSSGLNSAGVSAFGNPEYRDEMIDLAARYVQVELTSTQIKALNTTPILLVTSPGSGKALMPVAVYATINYNTGTYAAGGRPIDVEYGGSRTGEKVMSVTHSLVQATADKTQVVFASSGVAPLDNTALYAHIDAANPTAGDSSIFLRVYYRIIPYLMD
jgi:hypothetical protein